jgi:TetR/AcrR family transcriptional repressor of nem operon
MGRPRKFTNTQLARDAMGVFWDRGFRGASVSDLSRATGALPGSLYGAFGDKRGLFAAALNCYMNDGHERVRELLGQASSPLDGLRLYLQWQVDLACGAAGRHGCMMVKTAMELAPEDAPAAATVHRTFTGLHELLTEAVRAAQLAGEISARWTPEAAAGALLALVEGFQVLGRTEPQDVLRASYELLLEALR